MPKISDLVAPGGTAPKRGEDLSGTDMRKNKCVSKTQTRHMGVHPPGGYCPVTYIFQKAMQNFTPISATIAEICNRTEK